MKNKTTKILITATLLLFSTLNCNAQKMSQEEFKSAIIEQITLQAQKQVDKLGGGDIEVKILNMPQGGIEVQNKLKITVESNTNGFLSRDIKRVSVYDGNNFVKSFPIGVNTLVYREVLCALNPIVRDQAITVSNSSLQKAQIGEYLGQTMDKKPNNQLVATRNIPKGSPILKNYVKSKPDVIKDSTVNIIFESNDNLKITVDGKALKEGSIGDNVLVRSLKYNKVYHAVVSNKNEVTVKI